MLGQNREANLGNHGMVVADDAGKERLARRQQSQHVVVQLLLNGFGLPAGGLELAQRFRFCFGDGGRHGRMIVAGEAAGGMVFHERELDCPACGSADTTAVCDVHADRKSRKGATRGHCRTCEQMFDVDKVVAGQLVAAMKPGAVLGADITCPNCGYELRMQVVCGRCPECGEQIPRTVHLSNVCRQLSRRSVVPSVIFASMMVAGLIFGAYTDWGIAGHFVWLGALIQASMHTYSLIIEARAARSRNNIGVEIALRPFWAGTITQWVVMIFAAIFLLIF